MLMMISIIRYITVIQTNRKKKYFEQHSFLTVSICWLFGLVFALPPLFNWNRYIPEGIGFHCGLDWFDRSISSRIYFTITFLFVYFIPLIILFGVNIYVYCIIRRLLYGIITITKSNLLVNLSDQKHPSTSTTSSPSDNMKGQAQKFGPMMSAKSHHGGSRLVVRRMTDTVPANQIMRLNRLKADRRFALATIFLVSEYLLSWTPYAIVALFYLFNVEFLSQQSILMTICAFTAKISMILNPFIYVATIQTDQLKAMLYCKKCSCSHCTVKRQITNL
jgi:hypothetical protein